MRKYILQNLDCANCAALIEAHLKTLEYVKEVSIDFSTTSMLIDTSDIDKVEAEINRLEPEIVIISTTQTTTLNATDDHKTIPTSSFHPRKELIYTAICFIAYILACVFFHNSDTKPLLSEWLLFTGIYIATGGRVVYKAFRNICRGSVFDEYFLMTIATIGAFVLVLFPENDTCTLPEAVGVMMFFRIGEYLQELSIYKSRKSIKALLEVRPDYANLVDGDQLVKVSPVEVAVGCEIVIKPGERIPLDGEIISGLSQVDTSPLTGEPVPKVVSEKDTVLAGMINKTGLLRVKVTKLFSESSITKILELVENATHKKAKTQLFFTTFARYYTPVVVGLAFLTAVIPPVLLCSGDVPISTLFNIWIYRALVILVISCPCALVVSIPLTYFGGIGGASRKGILIKGSTYLDTLNKVKTIVFDKTGTLTKGVFKLTKIVPAEGWTADDLLSITAQAEAGSNHPIAMALKGGVGGQVTNYTEIAGQGIVAEINTPHSVIAGNARLLHSYGISFTETTDAGTIVYVAVDKQYAGYLVISDELKDDSAQAVKELRRQGIKDFHILTGDNYASAKAFADILKIENYHTNLLPEDKLSKLEEIIHTTHHTAHTTLFVGDGINDAPVLARADIGVSMGNIGSDAAIENADIVIMNDSLSKLPQMIGIARKTRSIVYQNIAFALGVKLLFVALGVWGVATMWEAVFADVGVTLLAVFNASRIIRG